MVIKEVGWILSGWPVFYKNVGWIPLSMWESFLLEIYKYFCKNTLNFEVYFDLDEVEKFNSPKLYFIKKSLTQTHYVIPTRKVPMLGGNS